MTQQFCRDDGSTILTEAEALRGLPALAFGLAGAALVVVALLAVLVDAAPPFFPPSAFFAEVVWRTIQVSCMLRPSAYIAWSIPLR